MKKIPDVILYYEVNEYNRKTVNDLHWSGEWKSPEIEDGKFIMIKKVAAIKKMKEELKQV